MLATLRRIVLEFTQEPELETALIRIVTQVKQAMDTDCCSLYLADYQKQHFMLMASDGLAKESLGSTTIGFSEGLVGLVGQREEPLNIANAQQHPHFMYAPEVKEEALHAFLGTPIIHHRKVIGVISIQQKQAREFDEDEEAFLVTLAAQLASAMANMETRGFALAPQSHSMHQIVAVPGAPGVAMAPAVIIQPQARLSAITLRKADDHEEQQQCFKRAVVKTRHDYQQMRAHLSQIIADNSVDIFDMYRQLLENESLGQEIESKIVEGWTAASALKLVIDAYVVQFEAIEDPYIRERASDIRDLGNRLLQNLRDDSDISSVVPESFVLVAEDVTASMLAEYQHLGLKAIISCAGSNNSHAAILARSLGVPAVMGVSALPLTLLEDKTVIVDGYRGEIFVSPDNAMISEYQHLINEEQALTTKVTSVMHLPAETTDGQRVAIQLNAGLTAGAEHLFQLGAEGIGLYRTEIPFMERSYFPSEQQQTQWYRDVLKAFPKQVVTMRTLDVGGDKALPYFPISEDNPFLGWRGIRITLDHPEIFLVQIRAMVRANQDFENLEIMLPMISNIAEVDDALRLVNQVHYELGQELAVTLPKPKVGIMLEVPAVLFQLPELAKRVDFFSVGSNDLTQYLLAVDRNNSRVSELYDAYHPAVLRALNTIAEQSQQYRIPLSLCGELAGEPAGALLLLAMGYDKLSMNPHNIARIKWVIRHIEYRQAKLILSHALTLSTAKQVHSYLNEQLELLGLGGFVRARM